MHRRRIYTEGKAKVIAAIWVTEFIQFLVALAILPGAILKIMMNSSFFSNRPGAIHPILKIVQGKTVCAARN